jgi:hypothetical protein
MTALVIIQGIVVLLLAVLVVGLLRSHAEILKALHDLGINLEDGAPTGGTRTFELGSRSGDTVARSAAGDHDTRIGDNGLAIPSEGPLGAAHDLMGVTPSGDGAAISVTGTDHLTLLAFLSTGCMTCLDFWDAFRDPTNRTVAGRGTRLVAVTKGPESESPAAVAELADASLDTLLSTEAYDDYSVPVAPYFVLVDGAGGRIVGEGAAASFDQLESLMAKALADGGYGSGGQRSRRDVLRGRRRQSTADEALEAAGIGPGHPSLHENPEGDRSDDR